MAGEYETAINSDTTLGIAGMFWSPDLGKDFDLTALGIGAGAKKYLRGELFSGVYVSGGASLVALTGEYKGDSASGIALAASAGAGMRWLFDSGFLLDLGLGVSFPLVTTVSEGDMSESDIGGSMGTAIGFSLGYAW